MEILALIIAFVQAHWTSIAVIATAAPVMWQLLQKKAFQAFLLLCLDLVRQIAVEELSGPEKRKAVVEAALAVAPLWVKKLVSQEEAEQIAEKAYMLLRGELKALEVVPPSEEAPKN